MRKRENIFTALTAAAILACGYLWGIELCRNGSSPLPYLGLLCTAAAAGFLIPLLSSKRRRLDDLEQRHQEELSSLEQRHTQALAEMRAQNQADMDSFRSGLSHSLRMPVAIIQGYAGLLADGVIDDTDMAKEYLHKMIQRSEYISDAISRQFSTVDTIDGSKLNCSDLDLVALVQQVAADIQAAADDQVVRIQVVSSDETLPMQADRYLLSRVLFNLLENSLKYMGRPGVITIRLLRQEDTTSILVQDDGMGIPPDEVAHIFERNYQGSNHVTGQGYGLHLVKRAIEAHGGTVRAQSAPGRGMGISIVLPLLQPGPTAS